jgi:AcrR family transcriptional regulator
MVTKEKNIKSASGNTRQQVVDAALRCFKKFGVAKTRIADIAAEANLSRQTVYRMFATREDILQSIASDRIVKLAAKLQAKFATYATLREALVEGSIASLKMGKKDPLIPEIFEQGGNHTLDQFIFGGSEEVRQDMRALWRPLLDQARESGELRADISNEAAVEWIHNIHGIFTIRDDYDEAKQRQILMKFLVPSLIDIAKEKV